MFGSLRKFVNVACLGKFHTFCTILRGSGVLSLQKLKVECRQSSEKKVEYRQAEVRVLFRITRQKLEASSPI